MPDDLLVSVKGLVPTPTGCGIFLQHGAKAIAIFVDHSVAAAITMSMNKIRKPRPLTHDLIGNILAGLGVTAQKVVIHDLRDETYYARISLLQENELGKSLAEVDSRPSDAIALALQLGCPIYVSPSVWAQAEDMTWALEQQEKKPPADGGEPADGDG